MGITSLEYVIVCQISSIRRYLIAVNGMADSELKVVVLEEKYDQDSVAKLVLITTAVTIAVGILIATAGYLYFHQPQPKTFKAVEEWRVRPPVSEEIPYLSRPDLLQWTAEVVRHLFVLDFYRYNDQLKKLMPYFTDDGWKVFLNQLNNYASPDTVKANKFFVNGAPTGAPTVLTEGLLTGSYAWWVQIPIDINYAYAGGDKVPFKQSLTLQLLVTRVSTLNNLSGVAIANVAVVTKNAQNQNKPLGNG